jgi:PIN domain nuclease of toxin-antitoxin system
VSNVYVLDTHTLLWYLDDDARLGRNAGKILDDPNAKLILPAIALAEALFILEKRPERHKLGIDELLQKLQQDPRIKVYALSERVVLDTLQCNSIDEMHDRQIVATARLAQLTGTQVTILTRDENIRRSGLVPTLW